jgi:outer membrane protein assembly factor BamE (lipoprotein component of BamABCDE complex)
MLHLLNAKKPLWIALSALGLSLALGACAPTITKHGYVNIDANPQTDIKLGDSMIVVRDKLGAPSQTSYYNANEWFYIDQNLTKMTYKPTNVTARSITRIVFDPSTKAVSEIELIDLADGRTLTPDQRKTPTRGRALTALEQILGTVGRQRVTNDDENPDRRRRE